MATQQVKYHSIYTTTDFESVGNVFPQAVSVYSDLKRVVNALKDPTSYAAYEAMRNIWHGPVAQDTVWDFYLEKKAVLTDVLSSASLLIDPGFLISTRVYDILREFDGGTVEFINCLVHDKRQSYPYFYLYPRGGLVDRHIDIENTVFVLLDATDDNFRLEYKANNMQHFKQRMQNVSFTRRLTTKDGLYFRDYLPTADIIMLEYFGSRLFVSERLWERLEASRITGLEMNENPIIIKMKTGRS
jgi:hypothetical protein